MSEEKKNKLSDEQVEQVSGGVSRNIFDDAKEKAESQLEEKFHPVKVSRHIHKQ